MRQYTEQLSVYRPTQVVSATDLSVLPAAVALVGTISGNIHRGTAAAQMAANNLGIFGVVPAELYSALYNAGSLGDRYVIADERGQLWVVHGVPTSHGRYTPTSHVKALLTLLRIKPIGVA